MNLNADFSQPAVVHGDQTEWLASPMPGVHRRMLDRVGDEVARATSIVRYAPGSRFSPHTHEGGEEFLVLEGVFEDEHGAFPAGTYVRNPPTSQHQPGSTEGCVIFVKLWQFEPSDRTEVRIDSASASLTPDPERPGCSALPLFEDDRETVAIEAWQPGASLTLATPRGLELLVLEGELISDGNGERLRAQSWLRLPCGARFEATAGPAGARFYVKTGHLAPEVLETTAVPPQPTV